MPRHDHGRSRRLGLAASVLLLACRGPASAPAPRTSTGAHVLVVGGTGMLRSVAMELARRGHVTSVIARSRADLERMAEESTGRVQPLPLDYRDADALGSQLRAAIDEHGPIVLVVAWIHDTAPDAPIAIARIASGHGPVRYVHVLGSAADDPSRPEASRRAELEAIDGVTYHEVILGFQREDGASRWLTDEEIATGVLQAIDDPAPRRIVGTTRPWSERP